jgi:hypothetical protein
MTGATITFQLAGVDAQLSAAEVTEIVQQAFDGIARQEHTPKITIGKYGMVLEIAPVGWIVTEDEIGVAQ